MSKAKFIFTFAAYTITAFILIHIVAFMLGLMPYLILAGGIAGSVTLYKHVKGRNELSANKSKMLGS